MMIYIRLFWEFFKAGLFAIGGGMATVPFLQDISRKTGWYTAGDLADMIAVSESTPGPIGVNGNLCGIYDGAQSFGPRWRGSWGSDRDGRTDDAFCHHYPYYRQIPGKVPE